MSSQPDWMVWVLAAGVALLFIAFFAYVGVALLRGFVRGVAFIQNWPQMRRAMTEAEAKAGGRYPFWFRAIRVLLIGAMVALCAFLVWRKVSSF